MADGYPFEAMRQLRARDAIARAYVDAFRAFHASDADPKLADALDLVEAELLAAYGQDPGLYRLVKGAEHERSFTQPTMICGPTTGCGASVPMVLVSPEMWGMPAQCPQCGNVFMQGLFIGRSLMQTSAVPIAHCGQGARVQVDFGPDALRHG